MIKNTLTGLDKKKLRRWILLFFFALAIPTVILIQQSYSRLKWETFHQHQLMAGELATRIDNQFIRLINKEEERAFTDYSFLNIAGDPKANLLQRSPLSKFPIESDINGVIGFFQVNNKGELMTPLVPEAIKSGKSAESFGISKDELGSRLALQHQIQRILSQDNLVKSTLPSDKPILGKSKGQNKSHRKDRENTPGKALTNSKSAPASIRANSRVNRKEDKSQVAFDRLKARPSKTSAETKLGRLEDLKISKRYEEKGSKEGVQITQNKAQNTYSKAPGKRLSKQIRKEHNVLPESELAEIISPVNGSIQTQSSDDGSSDSASSDKDGYFSDDSVLNGSVSSISSISSESALTSLSKDEAVGVQGTKIDAKRTKNSKNSKNIVSPKRVLKILSFESTIDPFEFSQLDSGHFILYRNVWLNDQRYIQGLLIEKQTFLESIINTAFRHSSLAAMSDVLVVHQGNVLTAFSGQNTNYLTSKRELQGKFGGEFGGELLYQTRLSAPLSDLQLLFNITQLPIGAGGKVILWLSFILASILCVGFYLMYRLGLSQINLARQQQNFVSAVSHELKTPLTSIRMYGEILREGWANEEKKKSYYDFIYHESERLSRLINNVLHLASMTRNEQSAVIKKTKIGKLMDLVNSKVSTQIKQAGYELAFDGGDKCDEDSIIEVDEDWFIQIMINLVDNAIKFSSNSDIKQVDITCTKIQDNQTNEAMVGFLVRDYGSGIDKQQMKKIFKLFYRSENELTRETVGTGIGLALVHQMTATMGGEIDVVNRSPGAEFRVSFPVSN